jgi:hypothetical protein
VACIPETLIPAIRWVPLEQVTLISATAYAELQWKAIELDLSAEKICSFARVLIQQNGVVREQMVSMPRSYVN